MAGGINEDGVALGRRRFSLAPRRRLSPPRERFFLERLDEGKKGNSITLCSFIILSRYNSFVRNPRLVNRKRVSQGGTV